MNLKGDILRKPYPETLIFSSPPLSFLSYTPKTNFSLIILLRKKIDRRTNTCGLHPLSRLYRCSPYLRYLLFIPSVSLLWVRCQAHQPRNLYYAFLFYSQCWCYCIVLCLLITRLVLLSSSMQLVTIIKQSLRLSWIMPTLLRLFVSFYPIFSAWWKTDPWAVSYLVISSLIHLISLISPLHSLNDEQVLYRLFSELI